MKAKAMEKTEELEIDIDDVGTILKSSRLKQKKSLEEISSELCIRKIYLTALEEGDYETLPPIPYGVGYVRTYARYLGLNPERAVKLYKASTVDEDKNEEVEEEVPVVNEGNHKHIIISLFVLLTVYAVWNLASQYNSSKKVEPIVTIEENVIESNAKIEDSSAIVIEADEEKISETTDSSDVITEVKEETNEVEVEPEVVENNKVVVEFVGESWVELKDKRKVYFQGVFHKGDKKEIDYADNLFISVGRPYNVKVFIKGVEKNIIAKRKKMNIPLDSLN